MNTQKSSKRLHRLVLADLRKIKIKIKMAVLVLADLRKNSMRERP